MADVFFRIFCDVAFSEGKDSAVAAYRNHIPGQKLQIMVEECERLVETVQRGEPGGVSVPGVEG